jgi:CBS domain-containing protein
MSALAHLHRAAIARAEVGPPARIRPVRPARGTAPQSARASSVARTMDRTPPVLHQSASLWSAWDLLHRTRTHDLVVVDDHERPVGVLDDRTIALEWPPGPMGAHRTPLHSLFRDRARPRVHAHDDLGTAARVLLGARTDAVPVVDEAGRLIGLVTLRHFARLAASGDRDRDPTAISAGSGSPDRG